VADVKKTVPWDLKVADDLSQTPRPTDDEIDFIRNFAPNIAIGRELMQELTLANMERKMKA
jgi:glutaconate CoA-transferase subunit B